MECPTISIFLVGLRPDQAISDLLQQTKRDSSKWVNEKNSAGEGFEWQSGYSAFSLMVCHKLNAVIDYIRNQKRTSQKRTFLEEYKEFLQKFEI